MYSPSFRIACTHDAVPLEASYRLRYEAIITERGFACSQLARKEKRLSEEADSHGHIFCATLPDGTLAGTTRINFLRDCVPQMFATLVEAIEDEIEDSNRVSVTSRMAISTPYRNSTLAARLAVAVYQYALENEIHQDAIWVEKHLMPMYCRMGYRPAAVAEIVHPQGGMVVPLLLRLRDWKYLGDIGSVFRRAPSFGRL